MRSKRPPTSIAFLTPERVPDAFIRPPGRGAWQREIESRLRNDDWVQVPRDASTFRRFSDCVHWFHRVTARCSKCEIYFVRSFETYEAANALCDAGEVPVFPCGHTGTELRASWKHGWTPKPAKRLPLYGESPAEFRYRELRDSWRFGQWITVRNKFRELAMEIDGYEDPYAVTIDDVETHFGAGFYRVVDLARWRDGPSCQADVEEECGYEDEECNTHCSYDPDEGWEERIEMLTEAKNAWLKAEGFVAEPHVCHRELVALDPPARGGVYFVLSTAPTSSPRVKIGWAKNSIAKRRRDLATSHPWDLILIGQILDAPISVESELHRRFDALRARDAAGAEWFELRDPLLSFIRELRV